MLFPHVPQAVPKVSPGAPQGCAQARDSSAPIMLTHVFTEPYFLPSLGPLGEREPVRKGKVDRFARPEGPTAFHGGGTEWAVYAPKGYPDWVRTCEEHWIEERST